MPIAMDASAWLSQLDILEGDITKLAVDAIVNAANSSLLGGGGVDGAIHRAAGRQLTEECRSLNGCSTGEAKITKGYNLPARYVIHTVGPIWRGGNRGEDGLLADCYRNCFAVAQQHDIKTLAFPAISTGAFAFPIDRASRIALGEIRQFLATSPKLERVSVVCFEKRVYDSYRSMLEQIE
jgi:O-acetyl-ADP-ribose deacetylase (regulator of RNase III)